MEAPVAILDQGDFHRVPVFRPARPRRGKFGKGRVRERMMCLPHPSRIITFKDTVEFTCTGVRFGGFLRVIRELQIGWLQVRGHPAVEGKRVWLFGCAFSNTLEQEQLAFW